MRLTLDLTSNKILVTDVDARYATIGRMLLERLAAPASALDAGESITVELDWATVRLQAYKHVAIAEEPDYGHDATCFHPSLTFTSLLWSAQQRLIGLLNIDAQPVGAMQYVHVSNQAMRAVSVVGHRRDEEDGPFTGWEIVSTTDVLDSASFGYYMVRELTEQRPAWLVALYLPPGWSFRFVGNTLVDCVSVHGETYTVNLSIDV
jgi:hypothetical protein